MQESKMQTRGWASNAQGLALLALAAGLISCGPVQVRGRCDYSELVGQCALMEVEDGDWIGADGVLRARYRIVQTSGGQLSYHLILKATCDPEYHDYTKRFLRDNLSVPCQLGALRRGKTSCAETRVVLGLPEPEMNLNLTYEVTHVSANEARMTREQPFGDGRSEAWP
ncbi:MAG: hypothetical protein ACI9U2_002866 [Bradymonadia bacterium]|jgi:hypothetical protein